MSTTIKQAIEALKARIAVAYTEVSAKGGTLPATQDSANLPSAIASIPSGGGGEVYYIGNLSFGAENGRVIDAENIISSSGSISDGSFSCDKAIYTEEILNLRGVFRSFTNGGSSVLKKLYFKDAELYGSFTYFRASNIEKFDFSGLRVISANVSFLQSGTYKSIISFIGDHTLQEVLNGDIVALSGISNSFSLAGSNADRASYLAIIKGLADMTGKKAQTFSIGATNLAKLTAEDIAIATNKNWNIA